MTATALSPILLCMALGLALAFGAMRSSAVSLGLAVATAAVSSFIWPAAFGPETALTACWISTGLTAASVHLPKKLLLKAAPLLAINAGVWTGALAAGPGDWTRLLLCLPAGLVFLPGLWMAARGWGIGLKVPASWLVAIALLAAALPIVSMPASQPDHMD